MTDYSDQDWVEIQHPEITKERNEAAQAVEVDEATTTMLATVPQPEPTRVTYQAFKEVWEEKGWTLVEVEDVEPGVTVQQQLDELAAAGVVGGEEPKTETAPQNPSAEEPKTRGGRPRKDDA